MGFALLAEPLRKRYATLPSGATTPPSVPSRGRIRMRSIGAACAMPRRSGAPSSGSDR